MKTFLPRLLALLFILSPLLAPPAAAQKLARKPSLGVMLGPVPEGAPGVLVRGVAPGQTGEAVGIREGDVILRAGGNAATSSGDVIAYGSRLAAGAPVEFTIRRGSQQLELRGRALPRPLERYAGVKLDYGAIPFRGGLIRDIMAMPEGVASPPVVFLLQGFGCASIEPADSNHPYRRLGEELLRRGIAYYRVEKPGLGDSVGPVQCTDIDFAAELESFRTAYRHLIEKRGIDPDRIFMFGHSLGGVQAPLLAAERAPRGVAAYGTVLRNWGDYHRDIGQFQAYLLYGADPVEEALDAERTREMFGRFYFQRQGPAQIAKEVPALAGSLRQIGWDGGDRLLGRHYKFLQDLAHVPVIAGWRDARTNVLSMFGQSDFAALFDVDHRLIANIANYYRPGTGRYVEVAGTDHPMMSVGSPEEVRARNMAQSGAPAPAASPARFNPEVARIVAEWIKEAMARPPVRTLPQRPAPAPTPPGGAG
jgi:pimeloyl-ACP methyl ester carboxylesterase